MIRRSLFLALLGFALCLGPAVARAQVMPPMNLLAGPIEIVLYVQADLARKPYIPLIVCTLEKLFTAPVRVQTVNLKFGPADRHNPAQLDTLKVANRMLATTAGDGGIGSFKFLLLSDDINEGKFNYVFAMSYGNSATPVHASVISLARLDDAVHNGGFPPSTGQVASRVLKIAVKAVAAMAGLKSDGCIMAFPRSLAELDAKPSTFCADDRAKLVEALILRDRELDRCDAQVAHAWPAWRRFAAPAALL